jgi:hypothetical protein
MGHKRRGRSVIAKAGRQQDEITNGHTITVKLDVGVGTGGPLSSPLFLHWL